MFVYAGSVILSFLLLSQSVCALVADDIVRELASLISQDFHSDSRGFSYEPKRINAIKSLHDSNYQRTETRDHFVLSELKFMYSQWYAHKIEAAKQIAASERADLSSRERAISFIVHLQPFINAGELDGALRFAESRNWPSAAPLRVLIEQCGIAPSARAFRAYDKLKKYAKLPEEWPEDSHHFKYVMQSDGSVTYRGIRLRSGDLIAADLALAHDGALESFAGEPPLYTHAGLFLNYVGQDGRRYPVVIEIHKYGKRLVPLAVWLSPQFVSLARVLRPFVATDISQELTDAYRQMPEISYDWLARNPRPDGLFTGGRSCATCTTLAAGLLIQVGVHFIMPHVNFNAQAVSNLRQLRMNDVNGWLPTNDEGMRNFWLSDVESFYAPSSLSSSSGLMSVGTIDNGLFVNNLARFMVVGYPELVGSMGHFMSHTHLRVDQLPMKFKIVATEVWAGQNKNLMGDVTLAIAGFQRSQMPDSAPPSIIAYHLVSNDALSIASENLRNCETIVAGRAAAQPFYLSRATQDPVLLQSLLREQQSSGLSRWFGVSP